MLAYDIIDYEDFNRIFGIEYHGNGAKSRRNRILLKHLQNRALLRYCRVNNDFTLLQIRNMADLKKRVLAAIMEQGKNDEALQHKVILMGKTYWSAQYRTDEKMGLCEDFDGRAVRYINCKTERAFKMKAGKFFTAILKETEIGQILSEQVIIWLSEEFTADWETYTFGQTPNVSLHVDDNFEKIYSSRWCKDFNGNSCMCDRGHYHFYEDAVNAKAAYITDKEGYILARAILFPECRDQFGKKWRLLERQYSRESSEVLKRTLIDLLIKGGYIDGYKQVGAGCSEATAFVDNGGNSLGHLRLSINCELGYYDTLSYQDSFKHYDMDANKAYNYYANGADYALDTTNYNLDGDCDEEDQDYDEYHDYSCDETRECYYHGSPINVDINNLDDFIWVEGEEEYYHKDDVSQCDQCGEWIVKELATYNETAEAYFCNEDCELEWKKNEWHYSEFDDDFYPNEDDITTARQWSDEYGEFTDITISKNSLDTLINRNQAFGQGDTWFITTNAIAQSA